MTYMKANRLENKLNFKIIGEKKKKSFRTAFQEK